MVFAERKLSQIGLNGRGHAFHWSFSAYSRAARMVLQILPAIPRGAHPKRGRGAVEIINGVATPTRPGARPPHSTHLPPRGD